MKTSNVCIVIPVYNEEKYLPSFLKQLLEDIKKLPEIRHIIFINDGSTDKTQRVLEKSQKKFPIIRLINSGKNHGKGYSMRVGFNKAQELGAHKIIFMDGDGQHDPASLQAFLTELDAFPIVFGYRNLKRNAPFIRKLGNKISNFIIKNVFNIHRKGDILCGYFGMRKDVFDKISWHSNDYGVEAEISAIIGRKMIPFNEIRVKTIYLDHAKGVNMFHAVQILLRIPYLSRVHSYS